MNAALLARAAAPFALLLALAILFGVSLARAETRAYETRSHAAGAPLRVAAAAKAGGGARIVALARADIGRNPTGQRFLWCMDAVNRWVARAGYRPTGSRHSSSALRWKRVPRAAARPGDVVWRSRGRRGGHVEIFAGWANPARTAYRAVTGNSCGPRGARRVCEITRPASRMQRVVRPF